LVGNWDKEVSGKNSECMLNVFIKGARAKEERRGREKEEEKG
jgi:hypothetical protein